MTSSPRAASVEQRLLWYMDHYRGEGGVLNCPVIFDVRGPLDRASLVGALDALLIRHEALRTTFVGRGRDLQRVVHASRSIELNTIDLRAVIDADGAAREALAEEVRTRIDPTDNPLRATLWRIADERQILCLNLHHLVADGWSCGLVFRDLRLLVDRACGRDVELPDGQWQYSDYVTWQQELLGGDQFRRQQEYWQQQLDGMRLPPLPVRPSADAGARRAATAAVDIDPAVCDALRQMARARQTTPFNVMLSLYYTLLHCLTAGTDLAVTSLFANRRRDEVRETVGAFATMVILRTQLTRNPTFGDLLREAHASVMGAFLNQAIPLQMVPAVATSSAAFRADDIVFHMAAEPLPEGPMGAAHARALQLEGVGNRFLLELAILPRDNRLTAVLSYNASRLDTHWARGFVAQYVALAALVARTPDARLADVARALATAVPATSG